MENVADQLDIAKGGTAQPQQPRHQRLCRIEGRAGKRTEAGDENAEFIAHPMNSLQSCPPPGLASGEPDDRLRRAPGIPERPIENQMRGGAYWIVRFRGR